MSYFRALAVLGSAGAAAAGPMLTGAVTYDPATQLYTYSYIAETRKPGGLPHIDLLALPG